MCGQCDHLLSDHSVGNAACCSNVFTLRVQVVEHQVPFGGLLDEKQCEDLLKSLLTTIFFHDVDKSFSYNASNFTSEIQ